MSVYIKTLLAEKRKAAIRVTMLPEYETGATDVEPLLAYIELLESVVDKQSEALVEIENMTWREREDEAQHVAARTLTEVDKMLGDSNE